MFVLHRMSADCAAASPAVVAAAVAAVAAAAAVPHACSLMS